MFHHAIIDLSCKYFVLSLSELSFELDSRRRMAHITKNSRLVQNEIHCMLKVNSLNYIWSIFEKVLVIMFVLIIVNIFGSIWVWWNRFVKNKDSVLSTWVRFTVSGQPMHKTVWENTSRRTTSVCAVQCDIMISVIFVYWWSQKRHYLCRWIFVQFQKSFC